MLREDFAVILLDVRMPQLDGYETAALIRQRGRSRYTPIIFLSGIDTLDTDVVRGLTSGAVDYLVKPVVPEILKNKVSVFVDLYRLREWVKQQALQQSEERFRLLVQGVQDHAIFMLDGEGFVMTWNIGAERLTGYRSEEILGQHYDSFFPNEELASGLPARDLQMAAAAEASCAEQDRWMVRKDATRFIANVDVTGLRDEQGGLQGYAVVIRDITERKRTEDQIQELTAQLVEEAKLAEIARLLGDIGHDVKNMMMPILLGVDLLEIELKELLDASSPAHARRANATRELSQEVFDMVRNNSRHVQDRVKEIADAVKGCSGPPNLAACRVSQVIASVFETLRFFAEQNRVSLLTENLDGLPVITADESRLFNAFYNLVNNAIPETPAGGAITIAGRMDAEAHEVILSVKDNGRGMPPEIRESLFTKRVISRKTGGTGLGTKIVKDVIDSHGGSISVDSEQGKGTTFVMRLPIDRTRMTVFV